MTNKPFGAEWVADYFHMVDRMDPDELVSWYTDDCSFAFANNPPALGKQAIVDALRSFYALISSMRHERRGVWLDRESAVWEANVHFQTKTGKAMILPAVSILNLHGGKIKDFRMYMDPTPITGS
jgi:ketosteroid isomerase-like protein